MAAVGKNEKRMGETMKTMETMKMVIRNNQKIHSMAEKQKSRKRILKMYKYAKILMKPLSFTLIYKQIQVEM